MIILGSWRSRARRPLAKVILAAGLTWTWLTPGILYSTGSSTVLILTDGWLRRLRILNREVLLPEPVGPVKRTIPCGRVRAVSRFSKLVPQKPKSSKVLALDDSFSILITTFSPSTIGKVLTRKAYSPLPTLTLKRPS